ncbi:MAG: Gfo/Idh/MocA family protein [Rhodobacterales bacterium]|jgi:predicted dehydrogenase|tara:strand:- start:1054 stop:2007 length:954 start_codon:yes stop_codon:yes gene_type:complete
MTIKVAIIGLGIMGRRMLEHMRLHSDYEPDYLWDPEENACKLALKENPQAHIMENSSDAIQAADLVYLACPPVVRKAYALEAARSGKALFLEKPFGVDVEDSVDLVTQLEGYAVPTAVNFSQASGIALTDLLEAKDRGDMGSILGVDMIITYPSWPRQWQKEADWLRFKAEGGMTREVISHFLFFSERVLGPLKVVSANTTYPDDPLLCETEVLARLESRQGCPVNILASVGGVQPDRQEFTIKGSLKSRRISEFYKDAESGGGEFIMLRDDPSDPRAVSLKGQLDDLSLNVKGLPNRLATIQEALRVQRLVERILK